MALPTQASSRRWEALPRAISAPCTRSTSTTTTTSDDEPLDTGPGAGDVAAPAPLRKGGIRRIGPFIKACWAELQRVQWPDRKQVGQATAVVLGFVVIAGAFLGVADIIAQRIVDFIL